MFDEMPRYWILWLAGALYIAFACTTHAVMAAPLASSYVITHATLEHPKRGVASFRYLVGNPVKLAGLGATWSSDWSATQPVSRRPHGRGNPRPPDWGH
jgi:hypothetical protein